MILRKQTSLAKSDVNSNLARNVCKQVQESTEDSDTDIVEESSEIEVEDLSEIKQNAKEIMKHQCQGLRLQQLWE